MPPVKKEQYLIKGIMARSVWQNNAGVYTSRITIVLDRPLPKNRKVSLKLSMVDANRNPSTATITPASRDLDQQLDKQAPGTRHVYVTVTVNPKMQANLRIKVELDGAKHNQDTGYTNLINFA